MRLKNVLGNIAKSGKRKSVHSPGTTSIHWKFLVNTSIFVVKKKILTCGAHRCIIIFRSSSTTVLQEIKASPVAEIMFSPLIAIKKEKFIKPLMRNTEGQGQGY